MIFFKKEVRSDVLSSWTLVFTSPKSIFSLGYLLPAVDVGALKTEYSFYKGGMPMSKNRAPTTFVMMEMNKKARIAAEGTTIK